MRDILQRIKDHEGDPDVAEYTGDILPDAADEIILLRARIEELKGDALRLDWLGQKCTGASDSERYLPFRVYWGGGSHHDIRSAIDSMMEES